MIWSIPCELTHENRTVPYGPHRLSPLAVCPSTNGASRYSPFDPPYVSHDLGNEIMTAFIEKFWAPSISFYDLLEPGHPTRSEL